VLLSARRLAVSMVVMGVAVLAFASASALAAAPEVTIEGESSAGVSATEARLEATINPGGSETSYHFEYGSATGSYDVSIPVPDREIPAGEAGVSVSVVATGLTPGATYHYRVVASNAQPGVVDGQDESFTTPALQGSGSPAGCPNEQLRAEQPYGLGLPDCRAYEHVSPADTNGQDATDPFANLYNRAAVSGEAITYASRGSFADPSGSFYENQFLSRREPGGWSTRSVSPPTNAYLTYEGKPFEGTIFTPELSDGVASSNTPLSLGVPPMTWELYRDDFASSTYLALTTGATQVQAEDSGTHGPFVLPVGASTDLSHVVFSGDGESTRGLYEWVNGETFPVSVTNSDGEAISAGAGAGVPGFPSDTDMWHAVSSNGSRVFFTSPAVDREGKGQLYVRENVERAQSPLGGTGGEECVVAEDACTVPIAAEARFWGANAEGSEVYYTKDGDLYEFDVDTGHTTDLAPGGEVQGVTQISEDGSYVYFVANGALTSTPSSHGLLPESGQPNLYVSHDGGAPVFIATLASNDVSDWAYDEEYRPEFKEYISYASPVSNTAAVSPGGSLLAFVSEQGLTGYNNEQVEPGECEGVIGHNFGEDETGKCREVYLYDAEQNRLVCASCNPSGARPVGPSDLNDGQEQVSQHKLRNFSEAGGLFFESSDAVVPHASDGLKNVYEYEGGHVYPISDVAGGFESFFVDASASGDDVFFATASKLLGGEGNRVVVYDARVGGGFPVSVSAPACDNGDSCKPPPTPEPAIFGAPGSATFSGAGNIAPVVTVKPAVKAKAKTVKCKKSYVKKKDKCVKKAKPKKKAGKSSDRKGSR
jgi:hypothetical protein